MSYIPKSWRKLFPHYWELGRRLERMDREAERQYHRDIDRVYAETEMHHLSRAKRLGRLDKIPEILAVTTSAKEQMHRMLEDRGIRQ